ncbi:hypothetical protein JI721_14290 [Alicyclobacillus cycloheptanicus]|uniref:Spo0E like sporulation regulatory protein n=1 Tax=Alicyclobacillus cycloheptanicus TaxID=1457 RepID=A0ABT9XLQ4_9BACL|nr:hypothetical protein [Alicyclobacillus cycloheptanicus]MDQ0191045.1 hypothetical protein [Alicyclobacillus cycloheptanicus]WDM00842.1 hypothetical protein JI721_14290 [Alicyclobacillus cycloheptanicus]
MEYQQVGPSLELDREILIAILASRYGLVPDALHQYIQHIDDETKLISLIRKLIRKAGANELGGK